MQKRVNDKLRVYIGIIFGLFIIFLFKSLLVFPLPGWDESVYIGMGKYLFSSGAVGAWEEIRPVALPILIGAAWKLGLNPLYTGRVLATIFSLVCLILLFMVTKTIFNRTAAVMTIFVYMMTPLVYKFGTVTLTSIPSVVFVLVAIYFFAKKNDLFLTGLFSAIAFLFRFPQGLLLVSVLLTILVTNYKKPRILFKKLSLCFAGFLAGTLPFLVFNYAMYGGEGGLIKAIFTPFIKATIHQSNPNYSGGLFFYIVNLFKNNPLFIVSVLALFILFKKRQFEISKILLLTCLILYLGYFSSIVNKQLRYALVFIPYLSMFAGYGFDYIFKKSRKIVLVACILLLFFMFLSGYFYNWDLALFKVDHSVEEFYSYFSNNQVEGIVLTTVPQPMVYSDIKFKPLYYVPWTHFSKLEKNIKAAMLVPSKVTCFQKTPDCLERKEKFLNDVREGNPVFLKQFNNKSYEIYVF